jgi:hypothetical protein
MGVRMKSLVVFLFLMTANVFAQDISVVIDGKSYVCSGGGSSVSNCQSNAEGFGVSLEYCAKQFYGGDCAKKLWPDFKKNNSSCAYSGLKYCLEYCEKQFYAGDCATKICI